MQKSVFHHNIAAFKHLHERLIQQLRIQGIHNEKVLEVMRNTPRHIFVDEALESYAYTNHALPIGYGQTISQPYIVARMTEQLLESGTVEKVLEVGTGCGYQTAILAQLVKKVYSIERIEKMLLKTKERLKILELESVALKHGDGYQGWKEYAPYQGIIVTAAPTVVPDALLEQLAVGGCMIIPVGFQYTGQVLQKIVRTHTRGYEQSILDHVSFVPLCEGIS
jgi:protein-L-isoaspartate(D-aspartate) O-methyltransferase